MFNKQFYINVPLIFFLIFFFIKIIDKEENEKIEISFKLISTVKSQIEGTIYLKGASYKKITHLLVNAFIDHKLSYETKKNILEYEKKDEIKKIKFLDNHYESLIVVINLNEGSNLPKEYIEEIVNLVKKSYRENLINQVDKIMKNSIYTFDRFTFNHQLVTKKDIESIKDGRYDFKNYNLLKEEYLGKDMKLFKVKYNFLNNS